MPTNQLVWIFQPAWAGFHQRWTLYEFLPNPKIKNIQKSKLSNKTLSKNQYCPKIKILQKSKSSKNENCQKIKIVQKFWSLKTSPGPATNNLCRLVLNKLKFFSAQLDWVYIVARLIQDYDQIVAQLGLGFG